MDELVEASYRVAEDIIARISDDMCDDRDTFSMLIYNHTNIQIDKALNAAANRAVSWLDQRTSVGDDDYIRYIITKKGE